MSRMTDVIFSAGIGGETAVEAMNCYLLERYGNVLVSTNDPRFARGWYTGRGMSPLYIGGFNYFDVNEFVAHTRTLTWDYPEFVQLFIREEESYKYMLIDIFELPESLSARDLS